MRNSGWYIPFWRKPKRSQGDSGQQERAEKRRRPRARSDDDLEHLRHEWIDRYTRQVRAFRTMGLSVGAPQQEIRDRYEQLLAELNGSAEAAERRRELRDAYETLFHNE